MIIKNLAYLHRVASRPSHDSSSFLAHVFYHPMVSSVPPAAAIPCKCPAIYPNSNLKRQILFSCFWPGPRLLVQWLMLPSLPGCSSWLHARSFSQYLARFDWQGYECGIGWQGIHIYPFCGLAKLCFLWKEMMCPLSISCRTWRKTSTCRHEYLRHEFICIFPEKLGLESERRTRTVQIMGFLFFGAPKLGNGIKIEKNWN